MRTPTTHTLTNAIESYTFIREDNAMLVTRYGGETWLCRQRMDAGDALDFWRNLRGQGYRTISQTVTA